MLYFPVNNWYWLHFNCLTSKQKKKIINKKNDLFYIQDHLSTICNNLCWELKFIGLWPAYFFRSWRGERLYVTGLSPHHINYWHLENHVFPIVLGRYFWFGYIIKAKPKSWSSFIAIKLITGDHKRIICSFYAYRKNNKICITKRLQLNQVWSHV